MRARSLVVIAALLLASRAAADDTVPPPVVIQTLTPMILRRDDGAERRVPPGRFLDEQTFQKLDARFRELEASKTRLSAENKSLRGALSSWQPGWGTLLITVASGITNGWAARRYVIDR